MRVNLRITGLLLCCFILLFSSSYAQQITGVWKGKINNQRVELKIIQKGDSLTGTSYYYGLTGSNKRYSIKGYFDPYSNSVVWWDDELLSGKQGNQLLSVADFNCPGGGRMFLDGKSSKKEDPKNATGEVSLTKINNPSFHDEWDFVLDNYSVGGNNPYIIDSISRISTVKTTPKKAPVAQPVKTEPVIVQPGKPKPAIVKNTPPVVEKKPEPARPSTIEELYTSRKKVFTKEIPLEGDFIQLHFYDNAEVDGDSISLFLNNRMIFTHVRLTAHAYIITLPVNELAGSNELVMVAENLGSIPPNTAFMIAMVGGKRYEAYMESTEESSCLIRFTKTQ
jgi:hypothetical protein